MGDRNNSKGKVCLPTHISLKTYSFSIVCGICYVLCKRHKCPGQLNLLYCYFEPPLHVWMDTPVHSLICAYPYGNYFVSPFRACCANLNLANGEECIFVILLKNFPSMWKYYLVLFLLKLYPSCQTINRKFKNTLMWRLLGGSLFNKKKKRPWEICITPYCFSLCGWVSHNSFKCILSNCSFGHPWQKKWECLFNTGIIKASNFARRPCFLSQFKLNFMWPDILGTHTLDCVSHLLYVCVIGA